TYRPEAYPKMPEEFQEIKTDFKQQAIGGDVLQGLQPIPAVAKEGDTRVAETSGKKGGKDNGKNVAKETPPPEDDTVGDEKPAPPGDDEARPAPAPAPAP